MLGLMTLVTLSALLSPPQAPAQVVGVSEKHMVAWLDRGTQEEKEAVVAHLQRLPTARLSQNVVRALGAELRRLDGERRRRAQDFAVVPPPTEFPTAYHVAILRLLSSLDKPPVQYLAGSLDTGWMAVRAVAKAQEEAISPLVAVTAGRDPLGSGEAAPDLVAGALSALGLILSDERAQVSEQARDEAQRAVRQRLEGNQDWRVVSAACQAAAASGVSGLKQRALRLSSDRRSVEMLGVSDPRQIQRVQAACAKSLSEK